MTTIHTIACPIPFPLKTVNCYYFHDATPTLIDSGLRTPESAAAIEAGIRDAGGSVARLERIIITHAHTDHAGLAGELARRSGARIYLHHRDYPKFIGSDVEKREQYFRQFMQFLRYAGLPKDLASSLTEGFSQRVAQWVCPIGDPVLLAGDETFAFDDFRLRVIHTPGHTLGGICLLDPDSGTLFPGDTLLEKITPNPVVEVSLWKKPNGYCSIGHFRGTLDTLARYDITRVLPGHGRAFDRAHERILAIRAHFEQCCGIVAQRMARDHAGHGGHRPFTLYRLTRSVFPGLTGMTIFLGVSEIYSYIQELEAAGHIAQWEEAGVGYYQLVTPS